MKTFQLLVKLGDKHGRRDSSRGCGVNTESNDHPEKWQIQFDQVLWLELQAWHHSRQLDEEDGHLVEERKKADSIFDEVIHFHSQLSWKSMRQGIQADYHWILKL